MAIEAMSQICQERHTLGVKRQLRLRDITFSKALAIPEAPSKVEIQMSLRARQNKNIGTPLGWQDFQVFLISQSGTWSKHCRGSVVVNFVTHEHDAEALHEDHLLAAAR